MSTDIGPEMDANASAMGALQTVRWYIEAAYPGIFDPNQMDDLNEDEIELLEAIHKMDAIIAWIPQIAETNIRILSLFDDTDIELEQIINKENGKNGE